VNNDVVNIAYNIIVSKLFNLIDLNIKIKNNIDRLKALELYAEVMGYKDKKSDPTLTQNFVHNSMTIKLVEPEKKEQKIKTIDNNEVEIQNSNSPLKLKLVG